MSAFRLHKETILPVLFFKCGDIRKVADKIMVKYNCIVEANRISLCHRYGSDDGFEPADVITIPDIIDLYHQFDNTYHVSAEQVVKLCHCIDYQNCEFDGYGNHRAAKIVRGAKVKAYLFLDGYISRLIPNYDELRWE